MFFVRQERFYYKAKMLRLVTAFAAILTAYTALPKSSLVVTGVSFPLSSPAHAL